MSPRKWFRQETATLTSPACSPASAPTIRKFVLTFDRERAKALGVSLNQITDALQVYMGSVYVNDFEFNNRAYRVYVQADKQFRSEARDIKEYYVRSDAGTMVRSKTW